jgi:hypothetical protein
MPKNAYRQSYRNMSELSSPLITLAVLELAVGNPALKTLLKQLNISRGETLISVW